MRSLRVYADTSVFGGCFEPRFSGASNEFFRQVVGCRFQLLVSFRTLAELENAPPHVQDVMESIPAFKVERIGVSDEVFHLSNEYLRAGILTEKSTADTEHIAAATIAEADRLISWNYRHIANADRIRMYNAINSLYGYKEIGIFTPAQVIDYEEI